MLNSYEFGYGRIIYASIADHRGFAKLRPAIILTSDEMIRSGNPLVVMAVTTTFHDPCPPNFVKLPWHPTGKSGTKLRQRSAAVINWLSTIVAGDIEGIGGIVPTRIMHAIEAKLAELNDE